ncbi:MAG TPA: N-6 DNA methylase [Candidatus Limnocylindrales bacterium]|nr:N-6 DNA methylase [Candidatus Limnocylindrales bacterium]
MGTMAQVFPSEQKLLGAFYTPVALAEHLVAWAIQDSASRVLEPACGEAVFLAAAARRLADLGAPGELVERNLVGYELDPNATAGAAEMLARDFGLRPSLAAASFFDVEPPDPGERFDAVVGNPPWIRYHHFGGATRWQAQRVAEDAGARLTGLASSWAAFVIHAASFLKPHGRLGFVLPAELLATDYAESVRRFLTQRFAETVVVTFRDRVFPGALVDAVLVMAAGEGPGSVEVVEVHDAAALNGLTRGTSSSGAGKWSHMLLPAEAAAVYSRVGAHQAVRRLGSAFSVDIGMVTGANQFFVIDRSTRRRFRLQADTRPVLPKSTPLGAVYRATDWRSAAQAGERAWFFMPRSDSGGAHDYIEWGQSRGFDRPYKCRERKVWWKLRDFVPPDFFLSYMAHKAPRFAANEARAGSTNLVHHVKAVEALGLPGSAVAAGFYNSLTLLSAELEGRAYGGGVLKLETKEAERLRLPLDVDRTVWAELDRRADLVDAAVRRGDFEMAADLIDPIVLGQGLGLDAGERAALRAGWRLMRTRREERGRSRP